MRCLKLCKAQEPWFNTLWFGFCCYRVLIFLALLILSSNNDHDVQEQSHGLVHSKLFWFQAQEVLCKELSKFQHHHLLSFHSFLYQPSTFLHNHLQNMWTFLHNRHLWFSFLANLKQLEEAKLHHITLHLIHALIYL